MLRRAKAKVVEERSTREAPLTDSEARALIREVDEVRVARGRRIEALKARQAKLADLKGPTGNYRAPIVRCGRVLLVGFQPEALADLLGA